MKEEFSKGKIFSYGLGKKKRFTLYVVLGFILVISLVLYYILSFRHSDNFFVQLIDPFFIHIGSELKAGSLLGAFYATALGGFFFVPISLEIIFLTFLRTGNSPILLIFIYIMGLIISYTCNYQIGYKLSGISKKIITPRKFYKIKGTINRYGIATIFIFNVLPLPSQALATVLGVFNYNRVKFYTFFLLGQIIQYCVITWAYFYIL